MMERQQVITALRGFVPELKAMGVLSASVFGSVARDEAGRDSDVDVAVRLGENFSRRGLDYVGRIMALEERLSRMLGCRVDVIEEPVRKQRMQVEIDKDRAFVF